MTVIETKNLSVRYGEQYGIKDVSLSIEQGMIFGLVGKNGAGKTTLMKALLGLINDYQGEIAIDGSKNLMNERKRIGSLIEEPAFYPNMTGFQNLNYYSKAFGYNNKAEILKILDLVKLSDVANKKYKAYSLGMKQRLGVGLALLGNPEILVLDEPINGIDPEGIVEIRNMLKSLAKNEGKTIIISSHILSELENTSDEICILNEGKVIDTISNKKKEKSKTHIIISTDNNKKLFEILDELKIESDDNNKLISNKNIDLNTLLSRIYESKLKINEIEIRKDSLEEYYLDRLEGNK